MLGWAQNLPGVGSLGGTGTQAGSDSVCGYRTAKVQRQLTLGSADFTVAPLLTRAPLTDAAFIELMVAFLRAVLYSRQSLAPWAPESEIWVLDPALAPCSFYNSFLSP